MSKSILGFFGHHKAGTTWIMSILNSLCMDMGIKHVHCHSPKIFNFKLQEFISKNNIRFISYTNANIKFIEPLLPFIKGFHVVRDPRDVIVSAYFSHLYSHSDRFWPELKDYRQQLKNVTKEEGLIITIKNLELLKTDGVELQFFNSLETWNYTLPNILEIKFEEFINRPYSVFLEIFKFLDLLHDAHQDWETILVYPVYAFNQITMRSLKKLGIPQQSPITLNKIYPWRLLKAVNDRSFDKLSGGRKVGQENLNSHYRKGTPGDWKQHFTEYHKEIFKEKYNHILTKLNYESDDKW